MKKQFQLMCQFNQNLPLSLVCIKDIALTSKLTSQHKFWIPQVNYAIMKLSWKSQNISFGILSTHSRECMFVSCHLSCDVLKGNACEGFWILTGFKVKNNNNNSNNIEINFLNEMHTHLRDFRVLTFQFWRVRQRK